MITDANALRPEFIPRDMMHRQGVIDHIASVLDPHMAIENISLFGPSGSGKTTVAKYVLRQIEGKNLDYRWGYVNCISNSSKSGALHQLVRSSELGRDIRRSGTPAGEYLDRIRDYDHMLSLVLDEVDVLDEPELIAALADMPDVTLITICCDQDKLHSQLHNEGRVRTRLRAAETIHLDRYNHSELSDILWYRVDHGLDRTRVDDEAIDFIADVAAGNARTAIAYLRRAASHVQMGKADNLTADVVEEIADDAHQDIRQRRVRHLGTHKRTLYEIIKSGTVEPSDLYESYRDDIQDPKTRRTVRRYLESMERYDLIESIGETSDTRYRLCESD